MRNKLIRNRIAVAAAAQIALILVVVNIYAHAQRNGRQRPLPAKRPGHQRPAPASAGASTKPAIPTPVPTSVSAPTSHESEELGSGIALDGRGKLWAVLIGVSNYKNLAPEHQLQFAHRDAEDFAAFLGSPNGGGLTSDQLTLLTDQEATLSALRATLGTTLPRAVGPEDIVIIFFAGHGVAENDRDVYLLSHDSDPQNLRATALHVSELNRIITKRLKTRKVVLITDACHQERVGLGSHSIGGATARINHHLAEIGKSNRGVFHLLASRGDEWSHEGERFGGGHSFFTWFLLEGLRGKADRDADGFVRVGELLDYVSDEVRLASRSFQRPRAAGDIDTQLPLAKIGKKAPEPPPTATLEVQGPPGLEVYIDNTFRGIVPPSGVLVIEQLEPGDHNISVLSRNINSITRKVSLSVDKTVLNLKDLAPESPLVKQIRNALRDDDIRGAFDLYQQLIKHSPEYPHLYSIRWDIRSKLIGIVRNAIDVYKRSSGTGIKRGTFHHSADAMRILKILEQGLKQGEEAILLFFEGQTMIEEQRFEEAVDKLKQAVALDSKDDYTHHALGFAYRGLKDNDQAFASFSRASELSGKWASPLMQMGSIYLEQGLTGKAEEAWNEVARRYPENHLPHQYLSRLYLKEGRLKEAEREADTAIRLDPTAKAPHLVLGQIYEELKLWGLAVSAYERGLALNSDLSEEDREAFFKRLKHCRKKAK
jgi:tetratricopeptide (TPR) repeat protein